MKSIKEETMESKTTKAATGIKMEKRMSVYRNALLGATGLVAVGVLAATATPAEAQMRFAVTGNFVGGLYFGAPDDYTLFEVVAVDGGTAGELDTTADTYTLTTRVTNAYESLDVEILETEVIFRGETTLDNGLTVGGRVEYEAANAFGVDESYFYIEGGFGGIEIGGHDGVMDTLHQGNPWFGFHSSDYGYYVTSASARVSATNNRGTTEPFNLAHATDDISRSHDIPGYFTTRVAPLVFGDSTGVSYKTPTFSGFTAGVSYYPELNSNPTRGVNPHRTAGNTNGIQYAANYTHKPSGFGASVGAFSVDANGGAGSTDPSGTNFGLSYGNVFKIDFGYGLYELAAAPMVVPSATSANPTPTNTHQSKEDVYTSLAFSYKPKGAKWSAYFGYLQGEREITTTRINHDDTLGSIPADQVSVRTTEATNYMFSYGYSLGGGVSVNVFYESGEVTDPALALPTDGAAYEDGSVITIDRTVVTPAEAGVFYPTGTYVSTGATRSIDRFGVVMAFSF